MGDFRRVPATLFLVLHFVVGMRLAVPSAAMTPSGHTPPATAVAAAAAGDHAAHTGHGSPSAAVVHGPSAGDPPCHRAATKTSVPGETPGSEHSSHDDAGCHGAPCCAPTMPHGQIRAIATCDVPVARQRPLVGAGRVIFADGARRRPPATAPPTAQNA